MNIKKATPSQRFITNIYNGVVTSIKKNTPAQRFITSIYKSCGIPLYLTKEDEHILNILSFQDRKHLLQVIEKLYKTNKNLFSNHYSSSEIVNSIIHLSEEYTPKSIQMVFDALQHYGLSDPGHVNNFIDLMDSFSKDSERENFIKIFQQNTTSPILPMRWLVPLDFLRREEDRKRFLTVYEQLGEPMISMKWRLPIYPKHERLTPLLLLKNQGEKLEPLQKILEKAAHTKYLNHNMRDLVARDSQSLNYILKIINLLSDAKLTTDNNLQNILYHSRLMQNAHHGKEGLRVQSQLLSALSDNKLLKQPNINALEALKFSTHSQAYFEELKDFRLDDPIFSFIAVLLDLSNQKLLTQSLLNQILSDVNKSFQEKKPDLQCLTSNLMDQLFSQQSDTLEKHINMTCAFFEGNRPQALQKLQDHTTVLEHHSKLSF